MIYFKKQLKSYYFPFGSIGPGLNLKVLRLIQAQFFNLFPPCFNELRTYFVSLFSKRQKLAKVANLTKLLDINVTCFLNYIILGLFAITFTFID